MSEPRYTGDRCSGNGGCRNPTDGRVASNYTIGGETRCKVVPGQPETRIDGDFLNRLEAGLGGRTLHDALNANGTPVYFVIGHSSYDSVFKISPEGVGDEKSIKFVPGATMFEVPDNCYYISTSATGWGMLSSGTSISTAEGLEAKDHILNCRYDKVMKNLFSNDYTCEGGRLDAAPGEASRIGVQVYDSKFEPTSQLWLDGIIAQLKEDGCEGLLTLQPGYFLPGQDAYNKSHQFFGGPLTRDGFGIIKLSPGSGGALADATLAVDAPAGRTRSHYVEGVKIPAEAKKKVGTLLSHMSLRDEDGNEVEGSVYFAKPRKEAEAKEWSPGEKACWELIRDRAGKEEEVYMDEIIRELQKGTTSPIIVCALSCSEQYVKTISKRDTVMQRTSGLDVSKGSRALQIDFAATRITPSLLPEEYRLGAQIMAAMVAGSLQFQTTLHVSNGKLWDTACSINASAGHDGEKNPLVVGWAGTEPTSRGTSLDRLVRAPETRGLVSDVTSAVAELQDEVGVNVQTVEVALPCFFAENWLSPLISYGNKSSAQKRGWDELESDDRGEGEVKRAWRTSTGASTAKGGTRASRKKRRTRRSRGAPRKRTKVRKPMLKKKTRNRRDRKSKSRKRTRRRR